MERPEQGATGGAAGVQGTRLRRILAFLRPYTAWVLLIGGIMVLATGLGNLYPFFIKYLIDEVFLGGSVLWLRRIVVGLALLALLQFGFSFLNGYLYTWLTARVLLDMRLHLYRHLHRLSMRFFKETKIGDIISRLNSDLAEVQSIAMESLMTFLGSLLALAIISAILLFYNWRLFLISSVAVPGVILLLRHFQPRLRRMARQLRDLNAEITSFVLEALRGARTVKSQGTQPAETRRFLRENRELIRQVIRFQVLTGFSSGVSGLLITFSSAAVLWFGGRMLFAGEMTAGQLMAFELFQIRLFGPVRSLVELYLRLQKARASIDRVFEFLERSPEVGDLPGARRLARLTGEVAFEDVTFGYEPGKPVLRRLSFRIPAGSRVALVGRSGSGKTTVADLLFRLYRPDSGQVTLDGRDLQELQIRPLLRQMALVPQDSFLFHGTIEENIRYGAGRGTSAEELRQAAAGAQLDDLIEELPQGYATRIGERGLRLSGGQGERIALARAFLRRPRILVLDEATSALDWLSERRLQSALRDLMRGRTTILITHKMFMVQEMDKILVLDEGILAEEGTHEELLAAGGLYRELYEQVQPAGREAEEGLPLTPLRGGEA